MKHAEAIILLLAVALSSVGRVAIIQQDDAPPVETAMPTETPAPPCPPGEFYASDMERCWPVVTETPTETPPWSADIRATMDVDPFDNDYQYIEWCFEYVDGGTRIIYFPCPAAAPEIP